MAVRRGRDGGVARVIFFQNPSLKNKICFHLEGVKVRENWLLFHKESKLGRGMRRWGGGGGGGGRGGTKASDFLQRI